MISIKAARVNANMTQKEAAKKLGISYQTLSLYENNSSRISIGLLIKMSKLYQMEMDKFFLGDTSNKLVKTG